jgi:hypothetical protein
MSRYAAAAAARTAAPAGLAVLAFLLITFTPAVWPGYAVLLLALAAGWAAHHPTQLGTGVASRVLLAVSALVPAATTGYAVPAAVTGGVLLGLLLSENLLHRLARPWFHAEHLPARPGPAAAAVVNGTAWGVNAGAVALVGLTTVAGVTGWVLVLPALAAAGFTAWLLADGLRRWRTGHRAELAVLTGQLRRHAPRFLLYFSAPPGSEYQVRMWLPQLERLGEAYAVVLPERHNLAAIAASTRAPVVVCDTFEALDAAMVPSLRAAFYVNNGMKNAHCVRFTGLTHVQLYHGDSDKAVTASPLNAMFDQIFVAGQAAIDRFAHYGVSIPRERFRVVGRPQVAALAVAEGHVGDRAERTVLYAPTWVGAHADSSYCSLPIAGAIIEALLGCGATVVLRPHPYTDRHRASAAHLRRAEQVLAQDRARTGREHRYGRATSTELGLFDCMNLADAMICDVSAVASEFLYTGKPFALTDMVGAGDAFADTFPLARAAYVIDRGAGNLDQVLGDLLERDPLRDDRRKLRGYYLGEFPPERYAEAFLTEARKVLEPRG